MVEVIVSAGIMTGVLIAVVALLASGLSIMQQSQRQLREVQIYNVIGAELTSTPFLNLETHVADRFPVYFDFEGGEVAASGDYIYRAECELQPVQMNGELRRASVSVRHKVESDAVTASSGNPGVRTFLLVNKESRR